MEPNVFLFRQVLGTRIDSLEIALQEHESGEAHARETIYRLIKAVLPPAEALGRNAIVNSARAVMGTNSDDLGPVVRTFIETLREEASGSSQRKSRVLLAGLSPDFSEAITQTLETPTRVFLAVSSGAQALQLVKEQAFACMVFSDPLPDLEAVTFLKQLRSSPLSAALPVLALSHAPTPALKEMIQLSASDAISMSGENHADVTEWITDRLRRTPESVRTAHRDILTGLLNRAAFHDAFDRIKRDCIEAREPLTIALLSADHSRAALDGFEPQLREDILQSFGLHLSNSLRASDVVSRWGLYEFAALFPGEDVFGGTRAVEKIVLQFKDSPLDLPKLPPIMLNVTAAVRPVLDDSAIDPIIVELEHDIERGTTAGGNCVYTAKGEKRGRKHKRILVLNRDEVTNRLLGRFFENAGFEAVSIGSGVEDGLKALESQRFHVVVIDDQFPPDGGAHVLERIRSDKRYSRLPVLMLIARQPHEDEVIAAALQKGASECLTRPFTPQLFMERLQRLIQRCAAVDTGDGVRRILVADPETATLVLAASALHRHRHFHVMLARTCEDALRRVEDEDVSVLLVSTGMRNAQQRHLLNVLSERGSLQNVDVILATTKDELPMKFENVQIRGTLLKPFDMMNLPSLVMKLLNIADSGSQPQTGFGARLNEEIRRVTRPPQV